MPPEINTILILTPAWRVRHSVCTGVDKVTNDVLQNLLLFLTLFQLQDYPRLIIQKVVDSLRNRDGVETQDSEAVSESVLRLKFRLRLMQSDYSELLRAGICSDMRYLVRQDSLDDVYYFLH